MDVENIFKMKRNEILTVHDTPSYSNNHGMPLSDDTGWYHADNSEFE